MRDQGDKRLVVERGDRERDAVDRDRALLDAVAEDLRRRLDREPLALELAHPADAVHVALDVVPTQRLPCRERRLEVDRVAEAFVRAVVSAITSKARWPFCASTTVRQTPSTLIESPIRGARDDLHLMANETVRARSRTIPVNTGRLLAERDCLDRLADERAGAAAGDVRPFELVAQLIDQLLRFGPELAGGASASRTWPTSTCPASQRESV